MPIALPACGLYRTSRALPGAESIIGEGLLVNFHNHSAQNMPVVLLPAFNVFNRWQWSTEPHYIRQLSWIDSLQRLPTEGFYSLRRELAFNDGKSKWPKGALVQLGYDKSGKAILFIAQLRHNLSENALWFAEQGVPLGTDSMGALEPIVVYEEPDPNSAGGETTHEP